jgi:hypothetical protein
LRGAAQLRAIVTHFSVGTTPPPTQVRCDPRPAVTVNTVRGGPGYLPVTIGATTTAGGATNTLQRLVFGTATNARIEAGTQTGIGNSTVELPTRPASTSFIVRPVIAGVAAHANLTVVDGCGNWPTFVGGGTDAF